MEHVENTVVKTQVSRSQLSDFSGAPITQSYHDDEVVKREDRVEFDTLDFGNRTFDLLLEGYSTTSLSYGPGTSPLVMYNLTQLMKSSSTFMCMTEYFEGLSYDSVEIRVTSSNPKGIAGGFFCGVYPFTIWNTGSFNDQPAFFGQNRMTIQHLLSAPHCQLVPFGAAQDVVFNVPWQHNVPYLSRSYIKNFSPTSATEQLFPGSPVIFFVNADASYVSTISMEATIRIFVTFHKLKFYAPILEPQCGIPYSDVDFDAQSGVTAAATALTALVIGEAANVGEEVLDTAVTSAIGNDADVANKSAYEDPQAVQLAYVGDSTKFGPPSCTPIFRPWGEKSKKHKLIDILREPQWLTMINTDSTLPIYNNPTCPLGVENVVGTNQNCTFLRFFSQGCSYWRGTIKYAFVILGHPMVEVSYYLQLFYPPYSFGVNRNFSQNGILRGVCSGVYTIEVPMPYMTPMDHLPILDSKNLSVDDIRAQSSSGMVVEFRVVGVALSLTPTIPIAVFQYAGDDFQFLQPYAVGLGNVISTEQMFELRKERKTKKKAGKPFSLPILDAEPQCGLPQVSEVFQTRAKAQLSTKQMVQMTTVEDFMDIWSRCLPFSEYDDNDEPIVTLQAGITPYWYPQISTDASHTLNTNNSWWVTNDFVSLYSSLFLYYEGSIGFKILCLPGSGYKYLTLNSGDEFRQPGHNPFSFVDIQLPPHANFGYGTVATDLSGQPVLEATIPLRSSLKWAFTNPQQMRHVRNGAYYATRLSGSLLTNVVLHVPEGDLQDALYRKVGKDFTLAVRTLLPPPTLWVAKGNDWS